MKKVIPNIKGNIVTGVIFAAGMSGIYTYVDEMPAYEAIKQGIAIGFGYIVVRSIVDIIWLWIDKRRKKAS